MTKRCKVTIWQASLLILIVFVYLSLYIIPTNIHGDGFSHTLIIREIVENQGLLNHYPYRIIKFDDNNNEIYFPLHYEQTFHVALAPIWMLGAQPLIKLVSIILGCFISLTIYIFLRDINKKIAFFAGLFVIINNIYMFIIGPLIEEYLLLMSVLALVYYYKFLRYNYKYKYAILAGIFFGCSVAAKQQGIILILAIFYFMLLYYFYSKLNKIKISIKPFLIVIIFTIIFGIMPLYDLYERTGTIGYSPGGTKISEKIPFSSYINSFLQSKFPIDKEAQEVIKKRKGYGFKNGQSIIHTIKQYFLFPKFYYRGAFISLNINFTWIIIFFTLFLLGCLYFYNKDKILFCLLFFLFIIEFIATYALNLRIYQYQPLALTIFVIFLVSGFFNLSNLRIFYSKKWLLSTISMFIVINLMMGYITYIHEPYWLKEGRNTDIELQRYEKMGHFIQKNIPNNSIFLTQDARFWWYAKRNTFWISNAYGSKVPLIFETNDPRIALKWLKYYNIDYIHINIAQTKRKGLHDYIPPNGLLNYIHKSPYFKEIYNVDNRLFLYKVEYPDNITQIMDP